MPGWLNPGAPPIATDVSGVLGVEIEAITDYRLQREFDADGVVGDRSPR
jgi:hypothetical protein